MRILFCGSGWFPIVEALAQRRPNDTVEVWDRTRPLASVVGAVSVILPSNGTIDAEVIHAADALRLIQQPAAGFDGIDVAQARARNIPVCNAPGANTVSVAEAATYLMLALARRAPEAAVAFAAGSIGVPLGMELNGKTLGLIGHGASATPFAQIARGLRMDVRAVNSRSSAAELDAVLRAADVVSLHCPLNPTTRGLVDRTFLAQMKPGALLINGARGPIIVREALEEALESGRLGGVGLDTYWTEPWNSSDSLFNRPNVVTLPHVAGSTVESFDRIADIVCENIRRLEAGLSLLHRIDA